VAILVVLYLGTKLAGNKQNDMDVLKRQLPKLS